MSISVFDLFSVGIGPSSSHTVGPMRAASQFMQVVRDTSCPSKISRLSVTLYGSLAATGKGHGTHRAVVLGLLELEPETINPADIEPALARVQQANSLKLSDGISVAFSASAIVENLEVLPFHPNGLTFEAEWVDGETLSQTYYSVGGGFVVQQGEAAGCDTHDFPEALDFTSAEQLLKLCHQRQCSIPQLMRARESVFRDERKVRSELQNIWHVMQSCVLRGVTQEGVLPGSLKVKRRAPQLHRELLNKQKNSANDPLEIMDWVNLYALAVSEENASGGQVVTAPTNGAAGIIPAVLHYYRDFVAGYSEQGVEDFLLTAAAVGTLYKINASISGAEVGCQGEVGSACSMAAAGLTSVLGGSLEQIEYAAEIAMEHNLGLTCDPVEGLVQVPCIERNAIAAVKAINAARMALRSDGQHCVSLDEVITTMRETGRDMNQKYKETATGGLAVEVPVRIIEC